MTNWDKLIHSQMKLSSLSTFFNDLQKNTVDNLCVFFQGLNLLLFNAHLNFKWNFKCNNKNPLPAKFLHCCIPFHPEEWSNLRNDYLILLMFEIEEWSIRVSIENLTLLKVIMPQITGLLPSASPRAVIYLWFRAFFTFYSLVQ